MEHIPNRTFFSTIALLLGLSLLMLGCGGPSPTPVSAPTATQVAVSKLTPVVTVDVSPDKQVQVRQQVALVIRVEPYEKLDWTWDVSGTSGGELSTKKGERVVYSAGTKPGLDIVAVEAKTASGAMIQRTVSLTVVEMPTATPLPPTATSPRPTATPSVSTATPTATPPAPSPVTLTTPTDGQTVPCSNIARGTYLLDLKEYIWPIVYIGGRYYQQDEGGKAASKANGNWYQTVRFGDCNQPPSVDKGKLFQLIIVTANDSANAEFERLIKAGIWTGLTELPPGTKEYTRIVVTRQ